MYILSLSELTQDREVTLQLGYSGRNQKQFILVLSAELVFDIFVGNMRKALFFKLLRALYPTFPTPVTASDF